MYKGWTGQPKRSSFNFWALAFGPFWMLWRKLYWLAAVHVFAIFFTGLVSVLLFGLGSMVDTVGAIAVNSVMGWVSYGHYMRLVQRRVGEAKTAFTNGEDQMQWLANKGGTSWPALIAGIIVYAGFMGLMMALAGMA